MNRGDVVLADFPFQDMSGSKVRPAIVVQNDSENQVSPNTILAMVTGNLRGSNHPAAVSIDPFGGEGLGSGLRGPSVIKCGNLATVRKHTVLQVIGRLSDEAMRKVDSGLVAALGLDESARRGGAIHQIWLRPTGRRAVDPIRRSILQCLRNDAAGVDSRTFSVKTQAPLAPTAGFEVGAGH